MVLPFSVMTVSSVFAASMSVRFVQAPNTRSARDSRRCCAARGRSDRRGGCRRLEAAEDLARQQPAGDDAISSVRAAPILRMALRSSLVNGCACRSAGERSPSDQWRLLGSKVVRNDRPGYNPAPRNLGGDGDRRGRAFRKVRRIEPRNQVCPLASMAVNWCTRGLLPITTHSTVGRRVDIRAANELSFVTALVPMRW